MVIEHQQTDCERQESTRFEWNPALREHVLSKPALYNHEFIKKAAARVFEDFDEHSMAFEIGAFAGKSVEMWLELMNENSLSNPMVVVDPYSISSVNNLDCGEFVNCLYETMKAHDQCFFFRQYSDDFFRIAGNLMIPKKRNIQPFGEIQFALVDGDHAPQVQARDISNTHKYTGDRYFVVCDDIHFDFEGISDHIEDTFKEAEIRYWRGGPLNIAQAYIWCGHEVPEDLISQVKEGEWLSKAR